MYFPYPISPTFPYLYLFFAFIALICLPFLRLSLMHDSAACSTAKSALNLNLKPFAYHSSVSPYNSFNLICNFSAHGMHIMMNSRLGKFKSSQCVSSLTTSFSHIKHSIVIPYPSIKCYLNFMLNYGIITNQYYAMAKYNV